MQTTHTRTWLHAHRNGLAFAGTLTLLITAFAYFGWGWPPAQASGARLDRWPLRNAPRGASTGAAAALFATITVTTTADENNTNLGACSLREAIVAANTNAPFGGCSAGAPGLDMIDFNIGAGTPSIAVTGLPLPPITQPVIINGSAGPGGATRVELNGTAAGVGANGLNITAGGSQIKALVINRFSANGISISSAGGNTIANCFIGTDAAGAAALGNGNIGVFISNVTNNTIGGTTAADRNLISGNTTFGILISGAAATGNKVTGNFIGTDVNGTADLGNGMDGVLINLASANTIGGTTAAERNLISGNDRNGADCDTGMGNKISGNYIGTDVNGVKALPNKFSGVVLTNGANNSTVGGTSAGERNIISGNGFYGVEIFNTGTTSNLVTGNYIGTDVNGTADLGNTLDGVNINLASNNTIGGSHTGEPNLISGNNQHGVSISGTTATGNKVSSNFIGTDVNGKADLGNSSDGVRIANAPSNTVGGTALGEGNLIFGNDLNGVRILGAFAVSDQVLGNSIFNNTLLGIELDPLGVTPNDPGDPDAGPNNLQNFPVITDVTNTTITGTLDSTTSNSSYPVRLEFFANTACDPSGNGEGEVFLGAMDIAAPGKFTFNYTPSAGKPIITATATDFRSNTSEFSACAAVAVPPVVKLTDPFGCTGPGDALTVTVEISNPALIAQPVTFTATLPAGLVGLPGTGTSTVGAAPSVTATGASFGPVTLAAGQSALVTYQVQVGDVASGTTLCITTTSTFSGAVGPTVQACTTLNCPAVGPGALFPSTGEVSDQKAGSVLVYNLYSSSIAAPNGQNTRITITNTNPASPIAVHLFFVDGATCSIADSLVCLTANQTASFLASDIDPGTTGYIVAVASDIVMGCPVDFNYLIGDEYVKLSSGHAANLAAEAFAAIAGGLPACNGQSVTALLSFNGTSYNRAPRVLAASNIPSRADGNDTLIVLNRLGGSLAAGAATLGSLFGILYDDAENPLSFTFTAGVCQFRSSLSSNFPRVAPRFENFIPAGRSGWAKFYSQSDIALLGAQINFNPNAGTAANAFNQGHNLHKLTLTSAATLTVPVFPPNC